MDRLRLYYSPEKIDKDVMIPKIVSYQFKVMLLRLFTIIEMYLLKILLVDLRLNMIFISI